MLALAKPGCIIIKYLKTKDKEKVLESAREKQCLTYKGKVMQMTLYFSSIENHKLAQYFSSAEIKLSIQNSILSENILQE